MYRQEFEIYELTCNTIRAQLKSMIKGYIRVGVNEYDELCVYINNDGFEFTYKISNYLDYILKNGTDGIAARIKSRLQKDVNDKYFRIGA